MSSPTISPKSSTRRYAYDPSHSSIPSNVGEPKENPSLENPQSTLSSVNYPSDKSEVTFFNHKTHDYEKICKSELLIYFYDLSSSLMSDQQKKIIKIARETQKKLNQSSLTEIDTEVYKKELSFLPDSFKASDLIENLIKAATHKNFYNCYDHTKINWFGFVNTTTTINLIIKTLENKKSVLFKKHFYSYIVHDSIKNIVSCVAKKLNILKEIDLEEDDNIKFVAPVLDNMLSKLNELPEVPGLSDGLAEKVVSSLTHFLNFAIKNKGNKYQKLGFKIIKTLTQFKKSIQLENIKDLDIYAVIQFLINNLNGLKNFDPQKESNIKSVDSTLEAVGGFLKWLKILSKFSDLPNKLVEEVASSLIHFWKWTAEIKKNEDQKFELKNKLINVLNDFDSDLKIKGTIIQFLLKKLQECDLKKEEDIKLVSYLLEILNQFSDLPNKLTEDVKSGFHKFSKRLFALHEEEIKQKISKNNSIVEKIIRKNNFPTEILKNLFTQSIKPKIGSSGVSYFTDVKLAISIVELILENMSLEITHLLKTRNKEDVKIKIIGLLKSKIKINNINNKEDMSLKIFQLLKTETGEDIDLEIIKRVLRKTKENKIITQQQLEDISHHVATIPTSAHVEPTKTEHDFSDKMSQNGDLLLKGKDMITLHGLCQIILRV